jgi:hypothetical protein
MDLQKMTMWPNKSMETSRRQFCASDAERKFGRTLARLGRALTALEKTTSA